mgnify:FL=1
MGVALSDMCQHVVSPGKGVCVWLNKLPKLIALNEYWIGWGSRRPATLVSVAAYRLKGFKRHSQQAHACRRMFVCRSCLCCSPGVLE